MEEVDLSKVRFSSIAFRRWKNVFDKKQDSSARFEMFLKDKAAMRAHAEGKLEELLASGEATEEEIRKAKEEVEKHTLKVAATMPHELVTQKLLNRINRGACDDYGNCNHSAVLNTTFAAIVKKIQDSCDPDAFTVPMSDVSGSMDGPPMQAAIFFGVATSLANKKSPWYGLVLPFSTQSEVIDVVTGNCNLGEPGFLEEAIKRIFKVAAGMSTDFVNAYKALTEYAVGNGITKDVFERTLVICFTDMGFNQAFGGDFDQWRDVLTQINHVQNSKGYSAKVQLLVYNLREDFSNALPTPPDAEGVAYMTGINPGMIQAVLNDPKKAMDSPIKVIVWNNPAYNGLWLP